MGLLPPSTNPNYRGARASVMFLGLAAFLTIVPGLIHSFLPDGGAQVIAHLDLGDRARLVRGVFAWEGATQLAWGGAMAVVAWRYRTLTPIFLLLMALERGLMAVEGWVVLPPGDGRHPPEHYASLIAVPLALVFLVLSLRARDPPTGATTA